MIEIKKKELMIGYHQMEPLKSDSPRKKETKSENKETKQVNKINDTTPHFLSSHDFN